MISSMRSDTLHKLAALPLTPLFRTVAAAIGFLLLLRLVLGLSWSADDLGNAFTFLSLKKAGSGLFSSEIWLAPHYNRFPVNTAYLYWTHTALLADAWPAHVLKWVLLVLMSCLVFQAIRLHTPPSPAAGMLAFLSSLFVMTSWPMTITVVDLSCTHYLLTFVFALIAALLFPLRWGRVASAIAVWFATFSSDIGVVMAVQILLLQAAARNVPLFTRRNALWLAVAWAPFFAVKMAIWWQGGWQALIWRAYALEPRDAGINLLTAVRFLFFPDHALPGLVIGSLMVLLVFDAFRRHWAQAGNPAWPFDARGIRSRLSASPRIKMNALFFALALGLSCLPFVLFGRSSQSPRLYSEAALIFALWSPFLLACVYRYRGHFLAALGILVANQLLCFHHETRAYVESATSLDQFRRTYANTSLSLGTFEHSYVLRYHPPEFGPLAQQWGLPLLLRENLLREALLGWSPLRSNQQVFVAFGDNPKVCLPEGWSPRDVEYSQFPRSRLTGTQICDSRCDSTSCVEPKP